MSLVLDTGTMKYRQNPNQPWRPLVIKAGMNWESMADTYDPDNGTYEVGQYVLEEGMMYRCISEITTPETWTPAHWTSVNVGDELSSFIIISDDQPTDETNKIWIAETTAPFGVQIPTMDDHNALGNTLTQLGNDVTALDGRLDTAEDDIDDLTSQVFASTSVSVSTIDEFIIYVTGASISAANIGKFFFKTALWSGNNIYNFMYGVTEDSATLGIVMSNSDMYFFKYQPGTAIYTKHITAT